MKKTYKSKVETRIAIPVAILLVATEALMIIYRIWPLAIAVALITILILYVYMNTIYELTGDDKLRIKTGFFYRKEIYIQSIKKVRETRNHLASPALSLDRLEILFNRYERVLISPHEKIEFINRLRQVNPRIVIN